MAKIVGLENLKNLNKLGKIQSFNVLDSMEVNQYCFQSQ